MGSESVRSKTGSSEPVFSDKTHPKQGDKVNRLGVLLCSVVLVTAACSDNSTEAQTTARTAPAQLEPSLTVGDVR